MERTMDLEAVRRDYAVATRAYEAAGAEGAFRITRGGEGKEIVALLEWPARHAGNEGK
jgi:hypothetical protein